MVTAKTPLSFAQLRQLIALFPPVEDPMVAALITQTGVRIVFWTVLDYRLVVVSVLFYGYSAEG